MDFDPCGICLDDPCSCFAKPKHKSDYDIAWDMLDKYKEIAKENWHLKEPRVDWMLELLKVVRKADNVNKSW